MGLTLFCSQPVDELQFVTISYCFERLIVAWGAWFSGIGSEREAWETSGE